MDRIVNIPGSDEADNQSTGKVARLGVELRSQVNAMLRDGSKTYSEISAWLAEQGKPGISENNISNWKKGGYAKWLRAQERIEQMQARAEVSVAMSKQLAESGVHVTDANSLILASQVNEVLEDFDPSLIKEVIASDPGAFFKLAKIVNSQTNERTKREKLEFEFKKYRDNVQEQKDKLAKSLAKATGSGISPETISEMESALRLL